MSTQNPILKTYMLSYKTHHGGLLGWNITSYLPAEEIPKQIETAAKEWLISKEGRLYIKEEELDEWGFDYANAMMEVPHDILAKHGIFMSASVYEIVELFADEDLMPDELKGG
ncbi:MAG: hypothetical protein IH859_03375 [Chloroflexi bacterium]|nr:hypothetical protein [Chloroflexota bacterium]